jgi:3-hydroxy-D-aspartate aldolase
LFDDHELLRVGDLWLNSNPSPQGRHEVLHRVASDEHGRLEFGAGEVGLSLGDKLKLIPGHCDPTVNLYDWYVCVRNGRVQALWPIVARAGVL